MRVTVIDDQWVRTHDEARDLLRYAALGATVILEPLREGRSPDARSYTLVLDGAVDYALSVADAYSLPCLAGPLAARARALCDTATRALAAHRRAA